MAIARRLYLYAVAGITLAMLIWALITLINLALQMAFGRGDSLFGSPDSSVRSQLSLVLATIAVALPVWALHWSIAERSLGSAVDSPERRSAVRALYLTIILLGLLGVLIGSGTQIVAYVLAALLGGALPGTIEALAPVGAFVVAGGFWLYHAWVRLRDLRTEMTGAAAWLPRAYRYLAMLIGLFTLLYGIFQLVGLAGDALELTGAGVLSGSGARPMALVGVYQSIVVGFVVWLGHWAYSVRLIEARDHAQPRLGVVGWVAVEHGESQQMDGALELGVQDRARNSRCECSAHRAFTAVIPSEAAGRRGTCTSSSAIAPFGVRLLPLAAGMRQMHPPATAALRTLLRRPLRDSPRRFCRGPVLRQVVLPVAPIDPARHVRDECRIFPALAALMRFERRQHPPEQRVVRVELSHSLLAALGFGAALLRGVCRAEHLPLRPPAGVGNPRVREQRLRNFACALHAFVATARLSCRGPLPSVQQPHGTNIVPWLRRVISDSPDWSARHPLPAADADPALPPSAFPKRAIP